MNIATLPRHRPRRLAVTGALAVIALAAAACGSPAASKTPSGSTKSSATSASAGGGGYGYSSGSSTTTTAPASSSSQALVKTAKVGSLGTILVTAKGYVLYTYKPDPKGKSVCTGSCATLWPPLTTSSASADIAGGHSGFSVIHRSGGVLQVAYEGKPLYTYSGDTAPLEAKGEGFLGLWYVVKVGASTSGSGSGSGSGGGW
jgi:predicted lipoprotein with Yx(FWY)xxD motif